MISYFLAFVASFAFIFLRAWQQLNVVHSKYVLVLPTSFLMAACEVYVIANVALFGWGWLVFWVGLGGGLGSMLSMWLHSKLRNVNDY